ncbi:hypothetical protein K1X76_05935 [bacterium]|nr:hypothetical protein [bacterium]
MSYFEVPDIFYEVKGDKAATFLHGQLTNSIKTLKNGECNYNLLLTLKGKVLADLYVYKKEDKFYFSCAPQAEPIIITHLKKMAPLSRVELIPYPTCVFHVLGANKAGVSFKTDRLGIEGYDVWDLDKPEGEIIPPETQECIRIENKITRWGIDFNDENLPQEALLDRALHFNKGCYLGQEIIARLHYKGHVNKIIGLLKSDTEMKKGDEIYYEKKAIGKITSSVYSKNYKSWMALGYLPYKLKDSNSAFEVGKSRIKTTLVV